MSTEPLTHKAGRTIGPYRLEAEIGRGGMGVVYHATRLDSGETVALKLMLPEIAANAHFRQRFIREATLGSDLDHPNVVPIYDAGEASGELYIAMRLVEGRDLKSIIEDQGALEPKRALAIMRQVASALDSAHEAGVVHHDIKPQNILISESDLAHRDLVYVTDFGLVRPAGSESTSSRTGAIFGSIQYMAPEQVEALACDGRADVYALGCVLYECLTGEIPFDRPNEVAVLWAHVHEQAARVTDRRPELAGGLDRVVATAMAKHPDDRYLTCGELVEELEKGLERKHRPVVMPVMRPLVKRIPRMKTEREVWAPNFFPEISRVKKVTERVNWIQVTGVTAILCLLAAALVQFAHPRGLPGAVSDVALAVGDSVLSAGQKIGSAFAEEETVEEPIGRSSTASERRDVSRARRPLAVERGPRPLGSRGAGPAPADRDRGAGKILVEPTDESQRAQAAMRHAVLFSAAIPANSCCDYGIYTMRPDGRRVRLLHNTPVDELDPVWSPDGRQIAFVRDADIYVMNSDGSGVRRVTVGSGPSRQPSWSPDGTQIVFSYRATNGPELYVVDVARDVVGLPRQLTQSPAGCVSCSSTHPDWSPDGSKIVFAMGSGGSTSLVTMNPDGSGLSSMLRTSEGISSPAWSPDGSQVVYVSGSVRDHRLQIFDMRARRVTTIRCGIGCLAPAWSPDGTKLAYTAGDRNKGIYVLKADGTGRRTRILSSVDAETTIDWR